MFKACATLGPRIIYFAQNTKIVILKKYVISYKRDKCLVANKKFYHNFYDSGKIEVSVLLKAKTLSNVCCAIRNVD